MGQKVHPKGFRIGIYLDWDARWFARKSYGDYILDDIKIRRYLARTLDRAEISRVEIERAGENIKIIIHSARPGFVIGKKGQEIDSLRRNLMKMLGVQSVEVSVSEIKRPELDATLVARNIAQQLERRASYKQAMRRASANTMRSGALGIKICCSGRLAGAEIARREWMREGRTPLHTLRSDIDYGFAEAMTTYGKIGVKVWICRGDYQL